MPTGIYIHKPCSKKTKNKISISRKKRKNIFGYLNSFKTRKKLSKIMKGKNEINASNWRGGIVIDNFGYIFIYQPNHPFKNNKNYVREHRLVVEKQIGRFLKPEETVHHINELKSDNKIENLILFSKKGYHAVFHRYNRYNPKHIIFDGRIRT